jgi:hypothetical protein
MRARLLQLPLALTLFLFVLGWSYFAQTPVTPANAVSLHIAGVVLDNVTGKPIEGATVATGKTDTSGHFSVDLQPGVTAFSVGKTGYNPGKLAGRTLPSNIPSQAVFAITLPPDQTWNNLVIRMNPSGSIKGRVFDVQGQPMQDAAVQAFIYLYSPLGVRYRVNLTSSTAKTNDLGVFQIDRLDAADYYLEIRPSSSDLGGGSVLAPVFYPNAMDAEHAEPIHVEPAAAIEIKNVSPPAMRGGNLSVRLINNTGEEPRGGAIIFVGRVGEIGFNLKTGMFTKDKIFDVQDLGILPSGKYFVYGGFVTASPGIAETRTYFEMNNGDVQIDLPVNKYKPLTVNGRAVIDGGPNDGRPVPGVKLVFHEVGVSSSTLSLNTATSPLLSSPAIVSQADGTFAVQGSRPINPQYPPYVYRIRPADLPSGMYVKAIRGIDGDAINPESGRDVNLTVVMGNDAGTIEGVLKDSKGEVAPLGVVVLIPDEPNAVLHIATATSNSKGVFKLDAAPGAYHLYAWHEMIGAPYLNSEYMSKYLENGIAVKVTANDRVTMDATALENR